MTERELMTISFFKTENKPSPETVDSFIRFYIHTGSPEEAARRCNIELYTALRLLDSKRVRRKINTICERAAANTLLKARAGLERLAFGRINDAAELVLSGDEESFSRFDGSDLYNISEIKRVKGGGVEVRFFDRLKAIEQLTELDERIASRTQSDRFLSAFHNTVVKGGENDEEG